jgi:hypothetical protein
VSSRLSEIARLVVRAQERRCFASFIYTLRT